jgi:NADPH2:quinone reductase
MVLTTDSLRYDQSPESKGHRGRGLMAIGPLCAPQFIRRRRMRAAYIEEIGPPENIRFGELPLPHLGPADVLVKVSAVCVDPIDTYIRSGKFPLTLPFPFIIGRDLLGIVAQCGSKVTRFRPGDRAWCNNQGYDGRQGTFAEYAAVPENLLYHLPTNAAPNEAVAFVHSGLTAHIGLEKAKLKSGESFFINGGSGNVGSAVLQFAKAQGARAVVTAGTMEGLDWCRNLGADRVVNYRTENVSRTIADFAPAGIDVWWDTSGQPDFDQAMERLARGGRIVLMAGMSARPPLPVGPFYIKGCSMHGFAVTNASSAELQAAADEINRWLPRDRLRVRIDRVLPLSEAATAHRFVEEKVPLAGKIVLTP